MKTIETETTNFPLVALTKIDLILFGGHWQLGLRT